MNEKNDNQKYNKKAEKEKIEYLTRKEFLEEKERNNKALDSFNKKLEKNSNDLKITSNLLNNILQRLNKLNAKLARLINPVTPSIKEHHIFKNFWSILTVCMFIISIIIFLFTILNFSI